MNGVQRRFTVVAAVAAAALIWTVSVALPSDSEVVAEPLVVSSPYRYQRDQLIRNQTLSHLFARHNVIGQELLQLLGQADGLEPRRVRPGMVFEFRYLTGDSIPNSVTYRVDQDRFVKLDRDGLGVWIGSSIEVDWSFSTVRVVGEINSSLWVAMDRAVGDSLLPRRERDKLIHALTDDIYGWVIDFYRDIWEGDEFRIVFERLESSEGDIRFGRVLAAEVETRGNKKSAFVITDQRGRNAYYDSDGLSLRRTFLINPVPFSGRISSNFSRSRFHPILRVRRPHLGMDIAARTNAEIRATADGVVESAGRDGGYGRAVVIQHAAGVETRYAHMSRIERGIGPGTRVVQGQRIGFVGMSGLATAPHLHYEFIKNGRHLDPRRLNVGDGTPVPESMRGEFERVSSEFRALLEGRNVVLRPPL